MSQVTSKDFWKTEVYGVGPLDDLERVETERVFGWLETSLPISGSRVDWPSVQGEHLHRRFADNVQLADEAAREILRRINPDRGVEHVGDGLSPFGIRFGGENASAVVAAVLEVPEHHYFIDVGRAWLVVVSIEGDLDTLDLPSTGGGP